MDDDRTIIRPRPGGSRGSGGGAGIRPRPAPSSAAGNDATVLRGRARREPVRLRDVATLRDGALAGLATPLLSLTVQLGQLQDPVGEAGLHQQVMDAVRRFQERAREAGFSASRVERASYLLCSFIDETVLNSPWGEQSNWSQKTALRAFHNETDGGEQVFRMIDRELESARRDHDFLELAYLCLSLGLKGRYRVDADGAVRLEEIRQSLYGVLHHTRDRRRDALSPEVEAAAGVVHRLHSFLPVWVLASVLGLAAFALYSLLLFDLNRHADTVGASLAGLVPPTEVQEASAEPGGVLAGRLRELMAPEIDQGLVAVQETGSRTMVVLESEDLFDSASATVNPSHEPLLGKLARALEAVEGRIVVAGHTDSQAIRTTRLPSNWHLSLERANSVARQLDERASLSGRLLPEGRGATEPVAGNDTAEGRARNRRVTIEIRTQ